MDIAYAAEADRRERNGIRSQNYLYGRPWEPIDHPEGFRAYVLLGKYRPKAMLQWETSGTGRKTYFSATAHRILVVVRAELAAGRALHTVTIGRLANASQGYVTKVLQRLHMWRFIVVSEVIRGRYGRILARWQERISQSFLHTRSGLVIGRNDYLRWADHRIETDIYVAGMAEGELYVPRPMRA